MTALRPSVNEKSCSESCAEFSPAFFHVSLLAGFISDDETAPVPRLARCLEQLTHCCLIYKGGGPRDKLSPEPCQQ
jgi:hypothetical protein